ncbi:MAG: hypothetical protein ACLSAF_01245 [Intestinimonas sp.]
MTTRAIKDNTSASAALTASSALVTMNTLRYALNRTTGPGAADTNYTTAMMRAIQASTTDPDRRKLQPDQRRHLPGVRVR